MLETTLIAVSLVLSLGSAASRPDDRELLETYRGELVCPSDLYAAHARLVQALRSGDVSAIAACCLPAAIPIETKPREGKPHLGRTINVPFARQGFAGHVLRLRQEHPDTMLVNTATSYLRYVKTASKTWLLYDYGDKPII